MIHGTLTNLRSVDRSDLERIHGWLDDSELMRWWGYGAPAPSRSATVRRIEEWLADELIWNHPVALMVETLDGDTCGLVILSRIAAIDRSCELSIFLEPAFRGQGIGADVIETITDVLFTQWNFHRLTVQSEEHNVAAHALFTRLGFVLEGRLREARFFDGAWHDVLIFGRLRATEGADT